MEQKDYGKTVKLNIHQIAIRESIKSLEIYDESVVSLIWVKNAFLFLHVEYLLIDLQFLVGKYCYNFERGPPKDNIKVWFKFD
jgi:hypothetical protein